MRASRNAALPPRDGVVANRARGRYGFVALATAVYSGQAEAARDWVDAMQVEDARASSADLAAAERDLCGDRPGLGLSGRNRARDLLTSKHDAATIGSPGRDSLDSPTWSRDAACSDGPVGTG